MNAFSRTSAFCSWIALATSLAVATLAIQPIAVAAPPAASASADEVRLANGGFVRGEIIELMPGEYVIIQTLGGETRRFEWSQVSSVERGGTTTPGTTTPIEPIEPIDQPEPDPEPEPEVEEPDDGGPTSKTPLVRLTVLGNKPMSLQRVTGRAVVFGSGGSASGLSYSRICTSPCDKLVENPDDEFFVIGDKATGSRPFTLGQNSSVYELRVKPRPRGMFIGGWTMIAFAPFAASLFAILPFLINMKHQQANANYALAGIVGAGMLGGGITMMVFSRTKVQVLPRDRQWLQTQPQPK